MNFNTNAQFSFGTYIELGKWVHMEVSFKSLSICKIPIYRVHDQNSGCFPFQIAYKVGSISIILNCPHNIGEIGITVAPQIFFYKHLNLEWIQMAF